MHLACYNLGWQSLHGEGTEKNEARYHELTVYACDHGDATACDDLFFQAGWDQAPVETARLYCDLWGADACHAVVLKLGEAMGGVAEIAEEVIALARKACSRGSSAVCSSLANMYRDYQNRCDAGMYSRDSCTLVGFFHRDGFELPSEAGDSLPADAKKAVAAFERACAAGAEVACAARRALAL